MLTRAEKPEDHAAVFEINRLAFETDEEARLVDVLRQEVKSLISLVGEKQGVIVGHILFTPVTVEGRNETWRAMGLGPMAVHPAHQRQGVGTALVRAGLAACREMGEAVVFVLGHPTYYPRFGFRPAPPQGLRFAAPDFDPYFFLLELQPGTAEGWRGWVRYHPAFNQQ